MSLLARDAKIKDLEEQVRDLMVYIEGSRLVEQSSEVRNATVVGVNPAPQTSLKAKGNRRKK